MAERHNSKDALEKLLARGLRHGLDATGKDCPDADVLAAYFDRTLIADEARHLELHFSSCGRCQEQLAALARSEPVANPSAHPALRFWRWQWLAPLAAGAAAVMLWIVMRPATTVPVATVHQPKAAEIASGAQPPKAPELVVRTQPPAAESAKLARELADKNVPPAAAEPKEGFASLNKAPASVAAIADGKQAPAAPARGEADAMASLGKRRDAAVSPSVGAVAATTAQERQAAESKVQEERPAARQNAMEASRAAQIQAPAGREQSQKVDQVAPAAAVSAPVSADEARDMPKKERAFEQEKRKQAAADSGRSAGFSELKALGPAVLHFTAPDGKNAWRYAGGVLQRSTDSGRTWANSLTPPQSLTAGTCISVKICWAVGHSGLVLRTTDGEKWETTSTPTPSNLTAVSATDSATATVTAADGKRFETSDAGKTWKPVK